MKLDSLPNIKGSTHRHKILGRGRGTGRDALGSHRVQPLVALRPDERDQGIDVDLVHSRASIARREGTCAAAFC